MNLPVGRYISTPAVTVLDRPSQFPFFLILRAFVDTPDRRRTDCRKEVACEAIRLPTDRDSDSRQTKQQPPQKNQARSASFISLSRQKASV